MLRETGSSVKPSPYLLFSSRLKIVGYIHEKFLCHPDLLFPSPSVFNARHRIEHSLFSRVHSIFSIPSFRLSNGTEWKVNRGDVPTFSPSQEIRIRNCSILISLVPRSSRIFLNPIEPVSREF